MVIIQRDFSLGGTHAEVSFAPRFLVHEGSTQSNFLLARRKVFRRERERDLVVQPTSSLLLLPSLNERGTRGWRGGCWPPKACFNSLIRRERQGAENNRAFSRGTFQSSSSARRVVPFSIGEGGEGWSVRRILKKSSRFVAFPSPIDVVVGIPVALRCPFFSFLFSFPETLAYALLSLSPPL